MLKITIIFDSHNDSPLYTSRIPYGVPSKLDEITISKNKVNITCNRKDESKYPDIMTKINNTFYKQILKSLVYYYCLVGINNKITCVLFELYKNNVVIDYLRYENNDIIQLFNGTISYQFTFNQANTSLLFQENNKGKAIKTSLTYFLKGSTSIDPFYKFDRFWRSLNKLYSYFGATTNDADCRIKLKTFIDQNPNYFNRTISKVNTLNGHDIRNQFKWRSYILDEFNSNREYSTLADTIIRYSDERVAVLFEQVLIYREKELNKVHRYITVVDHINECKRNHNRKDTDLIGLLALRYGCYLRNKTFHGEIDDNSFRLYKNKEDDQFRIMNEIIECLIFDIIDCINYWP
jgi:hypothetical protein